MHLHRGLPLVVFTLTTLAAPALVQAATANCMGAAGTCEVSNDGFDWTDCTCADGSGIGFGGGNEWAGLSEVELGPVCEEQLDSLCGPIVDPEQIECATVYGSCVIDNDPADTIDCECYDGTTGGVPGGGAWAGYSAEELFLECATQLTTLCLPPLTSFDCSNANGSCTIANEPVDFLSCECTNGAGGGESGGNAWFGHSALELFDECGSQLVGYCGGPLPPPPWVECSSSLGSCTVDNDPEDRLECTCVNGEEISSIGGSAWAGLSTDDLFMICEEQLYEGCSVGAGSGSGTDTGTTGDTDGTGSTGSGSATGQPGEDTGADGSGSASEGSSGTLPPDTAGDDTTEGASEGGDGGADDSGGGGCGCSATGRSNPGGWVLMLLGLVGVPRRPLQRPVTTPDRNVAAEALPLTARASDRRRRETSARAW